ncbi:hypothetical protein [Hyalangium versicolor]|uniref:hypothetical protein n=1 Tax=Hyalangium versicolor TaxID=2861190 RepID=UPI001CCF211A|nr:hypothetical protein [Hyalangium versicolor]
MRLALRIAAVGVRLPASTHHTNRLGTVIHTAYGHLFEPAGTRSHPPTVRRGGVLVLSDKYSTPTAADAERTSDMASAAVADVLSAASTAAPHIRSIIHAQCTLDQQILGSACMRIGYDHFRHASTAITVGQLGTAGIPAVLRLAAMDTAQGGLACISASDKWLAPFFRRVPGLVTHADAAAACLVASSDLISAPIAEIESVVASSQPPDHDLWTAPAERQLASVRALAERCITRLLQENPDVDRASLCLAGDDYETGLNSWLAQVTGIGGECLDGPLPGVHLSSPSPLAGLRTAVAAAVRMGRPVRAVIWTASPAGHAGALLVRCAPDAIATPTGWTSRHPFPPTIHGGVRHTRPQQGARHE